jgi:hypothetical protein
MTAVIVLNAVLCALVVVVIDGLLLRAISAEAKDQRADRWLPAPTAPRIWWWLRASTRLDRGFQGARG